MKLQTYKQLLYYLSMIGVFSGLMGIAIGLVTGALFTGFLIAVFLEVVLSGVYLFNLLFGPFFKRLLR